MVFVLDHNTIVFEYYGNSSLFFLATTIAKQLFFKTGEKRQMVFTFFSKRNALSNATCLSPTQKILKKKTSEIAQIAFANPNIHITSYNKEA